MWIDFAIFLVACQILTFSIIRIVEATGLYLCRRAERAGRLLGRARSLPDHFQLLCLHYNSTCADPMWVLEARHVLAKFGVGTAAD